MENYHYTPTNNGKLAFVRTHPNRDPETLFTYEPLQKVAFLIEADGTLHKHGVVDLIVAHHQKLRQAFDGTDLALDLMMVEIPVSLMMLDPVRDEVNYVLDRSGIAHTLPDRIARALSTQHSPA